MALPGLVLVVMRTGRIPVSRLEKKRQDSNSAQPLGSYT